MSWVRLSYMYRDAGNWKRHGHVVVVLGEEMDVAIAAERLRRACGSAGEFNAAQVGLPELFFDDGVTDDDHSWHEFIELEPTQDAPTDPRSLAQLVESFERERARGWRIDAHRLTWE